MVTKKQVGARVRGKGKVVASSSRHEEEIVEEREHDSMEEDSDEDSAHLESRTGKREKRRKRRTPAEMEADAVLDWVESIPNRGFKSERQISRRRFGNTSDIIVQLESQDVVAIAKYLRYERPPGDLINYPRDESIDLDVIVNELYSTLPNFRVPPHKPGKFTDTYRILNQIVHYNLYPRGAENKPSKKSAEVMYVFMNDADYAADWAKFIFDQLVDFKGETWHGPMSVPVHDHYVPKTESKSQSKPATAGRSAGPSSSATIDPSLWTVPDSKASKECIWRKLCCQNIAIWNCIQKEMKERKKLSREVRELKHELNWHTRYIETTTDDKYDAPPRVEAAASEDEVLFGPGAGPSGQ
ncbi:hypothetical protein RHMOL_Rhmol05G0210900 [Rhododendron molle]|uniref:Uncharacterized protein n=1 Tax=Rhododendron molle TaxID=49168 RepID=A0ACC0NSD2_RHOML|nr:hypothetical protein RHMOL_Rhmol05G0210900 [Rhododendron molle]